MQVQSNKLNCEGQNIFAGIDVHKKNWTVSVFSKQFEFKKFSQPPVADALKTYLHRNFPGAIYHSAYEAGFCGFHAHSCLLEAGINNIVVNAADVPTTDKEKTCKNDNRDSGKLCRSLRNGDLTCIHIPVRKTQEDRALLRMRYAITRDLARIKSRTKSLLNFFGIEHPERFSSSNTHWSRRYMEWLKTVEMKEESGRATFQAIIMEVEEMRKVVLEVTRKIRTLSLTESYQKDFQLMLSVPGIGPVTGMSFLTEIEDINRFASTDNFASYIGLTPSCHDSGEKNNKGKITPRAKDILRILIVECAWSAIRKDPALKTAFSTLCKRMEANKALIRIARKLLNRIYKVLKTKTEYVCGKVE
jgi:transposase